MKLTLKELFEKYPITSAGIARNIGMNETTFRSLKNGTLYLTAPAKAEHLKNIETEIHKLADELKKVRLV